MLNNNKQKGFVKESYKGKKKSGVLNKLLLSVLLGLLSGLVATLFFVIVAPSLMSYFHPVKEEPVVVKTEEIPQEKQENPEDGKTEKEGKSKEDEEHPDLYPQEPPVVMEKIVPLDVKDYQALYQNFGEIVQKLQKSVVQIVIEKSDASFIHSIEKYRNIGLIVAENKKSFFILTTYSKDANSAIKAVIGDSVHSVSVSGYNENTGIMIVKLNKSEISKELYDNLEVAELAVSNIDDLGKPIIVYGNLCDGRLGYANGSICSYEHTNRFVDSTYSMLMPTVLMDEDATAIIINLDGKVTGFVDKNSKTKFKEAFGIAELKSVIEKLSNEETIPVLGIRAESVIGKNIDKDITDGIFVFETVDNSPAMNNGILPGDVIIKIGDTNISNMQQVQNILRNYKSKDALKIVLMRQRFSRYEKIEIDVDLKNNK